MLNRVRLGTFAKKVGFKHAGVKGFRQHLNCLEKAGTIRIYQGGFPGHSTCHPKIVFINDWNAVKLHFRLRIDARTEKTKVRHVKRVKRRQIFRALCAFYKPCQFRKLNVKLDEMVCIMDGYCNQQRSTKI